MGQENMFDKDKYVIKAYVVFLVVQSLLKWPFFFSVRQFYLLGEEWVIK